MKLRQLTPEEFKKNRRHLIQFLQRHGDRRITREAIQWLRRIPSSQFDLEGNGIWAAQDGSKLLGFSAIADYGREESVIAVHKSYRQKGVAQDLIHEMKKVMGKLYGRIALDNTPSLKMSFAAGFVAFDLIEGPTGKPTIWVGTGDWKREDVR